MRVCLKQVSVWETRFLTKSWYQEHLTPHLGILPSGEWLGLTWHLASLLLFCIQSWLDTSGIWLMAGRRGEGRERRKGGREDAAGINMQITTLPLFSGLRSDGINHSASACKVLLHPSVHCPLQNQQLESAGAKENQRTSLSSKSMLQGTCSCGGSLRLLRVFTF